MATERLIIEITENGARVVKRNIEDIGKSASPVEGAIRKLKAALGALAAGVVLSQLRQLTDEFTRIQNRLRVVTTDQANLNAVFNQLQEVSARTRSSLAANAELYARIAISAKELGVSQQELLTFTERLNKAIKISGASTQEAEAGLIQLSQGMASGALRGDELRSVLEQLPAVADVIAKSMGVTRGELRQLGFEGKITAQEILKAFREAGPELEEKFGRTVPTLGEGFVILRNQLVETVGVLDQAAGASSFLGGVMSSVTKTLRELTPELANFIRALNGSLDPMDEMTTAGKVFATIFTTLIAVLNSLANIIYTVVVGAFNAAGKNIGAVAAAVAAIARGEFGEAADILKNRLVDAVDGMVTGTKDLYGELVNSTSGTIEQLVQIWDKGARQVQDRSKLAVGSVSATAGPGRETPVDEKGMDKLERRLTSLLNKINPIPGALLEMKRAREILNEANERHLLTDKQLEENLERLKLHYRDILDPLGALNREIDEEIQLLQMSSREREVEAQLMQLSQRLLADGVILTQQQTEALRERLQAMQDLNEVVMVQDELLAQSVERRREFQVQLEAIQNLLADPTSGFTGADATDALGGMLGDDLFVNTQEQLDAQAERFREMYDQVEQLRQADLVSEQTAAAMRARIWVDSQKQQLDTATNFFGQLSQLQKSENSKIAAIGKAAAIAQAIISTYRAATEAYAAMAGIPYVGPALGAAAAAAAVAAGLANVQQIRNQPTGFMTGGSFTVPGSGGPDSQNVMFRATPGERVSIQTPAQVRKGDPGGGREPAQPPQLNQRIINVVDPRMVADFLSTPEGEQVFVNVMRRNSDSVRSIAGTGVG